MVVFPVKSMDLPDYWFSDSPVPPLPGQRAHVNDLNKRSIIPVIKDAVLDHATDFKSLRVKYPVTAANGDTVLRPLSTCLPFGVPNRLSNLQDLCSSIIPFAIQSQEWIRESRYGAEQGLESQGNSGKRQGRRSVRRSEADSENPRPDNGGDDVSDAESLDEDVRSAGETHGFSKDEETDVLHHDWLLPLGDLPCIPDYRRFKPYKKDIERMEEAAKRAAVYCGFGRVNRLASPLNWWYSGGCLAYFGFEPDAGYLFHPTASLSLLETTPISVTEERSFKRIVSSGHKPQDTQLEEPIYQIVTQCMETADSAFIGARLSKELILLQMKNIATPELTIKRVIKAEHQDYFSHISASPYIRGEFLSASQNGKVSIWSVEREEPICGFDVQHMGFCELAQNHWIGCYFGNYPRATGVVTSNAVELFDGRLHSRNTAQIVLLGKGHYMNGVQDDIVAADLLADTSYHMILSTKEFLLVDQRFSKRPAVRYPLQCTTPALYLRCARGSSGAPNYIFGGSQMSQMAMCFELDAALESKPISLGSLPICTAAPRQLVPLAQLAGLHVDFSMKQRLEKPIIGMEVIPHSNDLGVSLAMISALGDLFIQSYETVENEGYDPDGVAAFSAVHPDVQLRKAEAKHLNKWLAAASAAVADPSSRLHLRLFNPDESTRISEEMSGYLARCSQAVVRQPHPHCARCNEASNMPENAVVGDKSVTCPRCCGPVYASRRRHMNGDVNKRFVFVEEVNDNEPIVLPENLQRAEERLREMALYNRIIHRILTKCYGETIDSSLLEPQSSQMPPPVEKKSRKKSKNVDQEELTRMFLENPEGTLLANDVLTNEQEEEDHTADFQEEVLHGITFDHGEYADVMHDVGDRFDPLATSTQQDPQDPTADTMDVTTESRRKSKKPKRMSGF